MLRDPNILLLCSDETEADIVRGLLGHAASVTPVRTLTDLKVMSEQSSYDVLFCGWSFHRYRWKDALVVIQSILGDMPVVFLSCSECGKERKEVLDAGAFDLLPAPSTKSQILAVLGQAVESQEARWRHVQPESVTRAN